MAVTTEFVKSRALREMTVTLTYEDVDTTKIFALPAGARVVDWVVNVRVAFNGTTPELNVEDADGGAILSAVDISTASRVVLATEVYQPCYETEAITGIFAAVSEGNTEGELALTCIFSLDKLTRI